MSEIFGWLHKDNREILDALIKRYHIRTVAEIGSFLGQSAVWFAERVDRVYCIDPWLENATQESGNNLVWTLDALKLPRDFFSLFCANVEAAGVKDKVTPIRGLSKDVAGQLPECDLVYIDGDHTYAGCKRDIEMYRDKARVVLCGDDYQARLERDGSPCFGVIEAVTEMLPEAQHQGGFWWWTKAPEEKQVKFSIIHPTARVTPDFEHAWWNACESLLLGCDDPKRVEYILVVDEAQIREFYWAQAGNFHPALQWPFEENPAIWGRFTVVTNFVHGGSAAARNAGTLAASGAIHIQMDDDMRFPNHWDTQLRELVPDTSQRVCVHAHVPGHRKDLLNPAIATRALVAAIGPLCPEYPGGICADDEWSAKARQLGTVLEDHRFRVEHFHPSVGTAKVDAAYAVHNAEEHYRIGREVFERRRAQGFPRADLPGWPESEPPTRKERILALCTPGEHHCCDWSRQYVALVFHLVNQGWTVRSYFGYTTNVFHTRMGMTRSMFTDSGKTGQEPERVLWIDDDNIPSIPAVRELMTTLDQHSEYSGALAWCWIKWRDEQGKIQYMQSAGNFRPGTLHLLPTKLSDFYADNGAPKQVEWSGFPTALIRYDAVKHLGTKAFLPIFTDQNEFGMTGEDVPWFVAGRDAGMKFCVCPRAKVEHLKFHEIEPDYIVGPNADPEHARNVEADRARHNGARVETTVEVKELMEASV